LVAKSPFKNDFPLGFFLTDANGVIRLKHEELLSKIAKAKAEAPMDYEGTLDDCSGIEIVIDSTEALYKRIQILKLFYPENAIEIEKRAQKSCNKNYKNYNLIKKTPIKEELEIELI